MTLVDFALLLLATLRLSRLVMADDLGKWMILRPTAQWLDGYLTRRVGDGDTPTQRADFEGYRKRVFLAGGLTCPFCIGFWIGAILLLVGYSLGNLGHFPGLFRLALGMLALNYLVGHIASRLGDVDANAPF